LAECRVSYRYSPNKNTAKRKVTKKEKNMQSSECSRCGNVNKHSWKDCLACEAECRSCHKKGHAKKCRSAKKVHNITQAHEEIPNDEGFAVLGEIRSAKTNEWIERVQLNGEEAVFKLDTGAEVTAIPSSMYTTEKHGALQAPHNVLYGPARYKLEAKGCFKGKLCIKKRTTVQHIYVVKELGKPLIGLPAIESPGLVKRLHTVESQQQGVKTQFPTVFSGLGKLKEPYKIELEPDAVPHALPSPCRVPFHLWDAVQTELERIEKLGVISKVTQPTPWCAGMVVVPKPRAKIPIRLCVDLTPLNKWVGRERHILTAVNDTLAMLAGAKVFTKLDATSGFWHIPLSEESKLLMTFITPFGRYVFNHLPLDFVSP